MLKVEHHGVIAHVVLDRPDVHNAFNNELIRKLTEAFSGLGAQVDIRAIILRAAGKSFSAGGDLNWVRRAASFTYDENLQDATAASNMFLTINQCPKPVIGRIQGAAIGGGAGLAAACDISVALETAEFGFPEVKLGIIPAIISPFVVGRIGTANAREYFLTGRRFSAVTAKAIGLIQQVAPDEAELDSTINAYLQDILTASPSAIAAAKELISGVAGKPPASASPFTAEMFARVRSGDDAKAGIAAFLSRSKAPWVLP